MLVSPKLKYQNFAPIVSSGRIQWLMVLSIQPPGGGINTVNKSPWTLKQVQSEDRQTQSEYSSGLSGRTSFQRSWSGGSHRSLMSRHHFLTCLETPPPASRQKRPSVLTHSQVGPHPPPITLTDRAGNLVLLRRKLTRTTCVCVDTSLETPKILLTEPVPELGHTEYQLLKLFILLWVLTTHKQVQRQSKLQQFWSRYWSLLLPAGRCWYDSSSNNYFTQNWRFSILINVI